MRFMVIVKASQSSEAGEMPDERLLTEMGTYNEELVKAGVMLAGEGLHPSAKGARVRFSSDKRTVVHGPFTETNELIAGFWLWQVDSLDEAIEWVMPSARVLADGCIVITAPVAVQEQMGFSSIDPGRLEQAMKQGGRFAQLAWDLIDTRREVGQVAAAASVSGQAGFGVPSGNTVVSGAFGGQVPETVIAPDPPRICPRAQLHEDELARQTVAGVRRIFADGGAVQP